MHLERGAQVVTKETVDQARAAARASSLGGSGPCVRRACLPSVSPMGACSSGGRAALDLRTRAKSWEEERHRQAEEDGERPAGSREEEGAASVPGTVACVGHASPSPGLCVRVCMHVCVEWAAHAQTRVCPWRREEVPRLRVSPPSSTQCHP